MPARRPETIAKQARARIARIREALGRIDYLCSGTLLERTKMCGRPGCACAQDPAARHGPYFEWGYMRAGKLEPAQRDYEILQKVFPTAFQIYYGLAEIAWQKKDTNAAIRYYELYFSQAGADS